MNTDTSNTLNFKKVFTSKKLWFLGAMLLFLVIAKISSAHQPYYIDKEVNITDSDPETSKAYYGELTGSAAEYVIVSKTEFSMYLGILSPDVTDAQKNYEVTLLNSSNEVVGTVNKPNALWEHWYETFGGDWYWQGPEFKQTLPAGTYKAIVSNPNNSGKYVLAVGEIESFPVSQTVHTVTELYKTKTEFFNEPWYGIFRGSIGKGILAFTIIVLALLVLLVWFIKRKFFKKILI